MLYHWAIPPDGKGHKCFPGEFFPQSLPQKWIFFQNSLVQKQNPRQGAPGFEPGTSRSAVECSTTELYPLAKKAEFDIGLSLYTASTWRSIFASVGVHRNIGDQLHRALNFLLTTPNAHWSRIDNSNENKQSAHILIVKSPSTPSRDRIVVSTLRCGRNNPGSNPGHGTF